MKLSALLAPLIAAKVPHEQIMSVILAFESEEQNALEHRRKVDADRQARKRSRDVTLRHSDTSLTRDRVARVEDNLLSSVIDTQDKKISKPRAMRLPAEFEPDLSWAETQGLSSSQAKSEAAKFRDYWSSKGSNATKTDWPATWRNWARTAAERIPSARASPANGKASLLGVFTDLANQMDNPDADLRSETSERRLPEIVRNLPIARSGG